LSTGPFKRQIQSLISCLLIIHPLLCMSQWELRCWLLRSLLFLHNPTFLQTMCSACCVLYSGFLLGLPFNPEDGGDIFLQCVGWLSVQYCENLKSYIIYFSLEFNVLK
jgi:hypothetical protein